MIKNRKITLWVIIILLILFIPITIFSTIMHFKNAKPVSGNKNQEFKYNGKLYFYDKNELIGTYTCKNSDGYCDYAVTKSKSEYSLDELKLDKGTKLSLVNNKYAFLLDAKMNELTSSEIFLYDILSNKVIAKYSEVKNYGVGIENDYYIVKNKNDKWGVISISDKVNVEIPFEYDYIGIQNKFGNTNEKVESEIFAVLKDGVWNLIDINEASFINSLNSEIFTYNNQYVVIKNGEYMDLLDFNGFTLLSMYKYINFYDKYLVIIDNMDNFYLYDSNTGIKLTDSYMVSSISDIELETSNNEIILKISNEEKERIAIN